MLRRWGCGARRRPGGACTSEYGLRVPRPSTCSSGAGVRSPWRLAFAPVRICNMSGITNRGNAPFRAFLQGNVGCSVSHEAWIMKSSTL